MNTSLAWLNLRHHKTRTLVAVTGVAFALILVFMQLGFLGAGQTGATLLYDRLDFDIVLVSRNYADLNHMGTSPRERLAQVRAVANVAEVAPLYADPVTVKGALRQTLPDDVAVFTREEFAEQEKEFCRSSTPIGFVFLVGLVMGFVVGVVICYQVLSADVARHLPEFATLKVIGFRNRYLTAVVLEEAVLLSVLGFLPGLALSGLPYRVLASVTGLPMHLTLLRATLVLVMAMVMCLLSGLFAIRKVQKADPAEVF